MGAERLQQMLFSDSPFLPGFLEQCKFTGRVPRPQAQGRGGEDEPRGRQVVLYTLSVVECGLKSSICETGVLCFLLAEWPWAGFQPLIISSSHNGGMTTAPALSGSQEN